MSRWQKHTRVSPKVTTQQFLAMLPNTESVYSSIDRTTVDSVGISTVTETMERLAELNTRGSITPTAAYAHKYRLDDNGRDYGGGAREYSRDPPRNAEGEVGYKYKFETPIDDGKKLSMKGLNLLASAFDLLVAESVGQGYYEHVEGMKHGDSSTDTEWYGWPREHRIENPRLYQLTEVPLPLSISRFEDTQKQFEAIALHNAESPTAIMVFARKDPQPGESKFAYYSYVRRAE